LKLYVSVAAVSFFVALSGAMMPGRMMLVTATASRKHGFRARPLMSTSHAALELVMVMVLFTGVRQLITRERLIGGLGIAGALVLVWMGIAAIAYARSANLIIIAGLFAATGIRRFL
jgi:threonine/homoserine/homoserine lactone efflux protein